jgi:hypothetical protein
MSKAIFLSILLVIAHPLAAGATQAHGGPEGLYVHQMAHIFFMFSMGLLIYWLRKRHLVSAVGWRYIQYAAIFFIAWNLDAFVSHWIEEQSALIEIQRLGSMRIDIQTAPGFGWLAPIYYLTKLDHLLSVPAMIFWFMGFRRLLKTPHVESGVREITS